MKAHETTPGKKYLNKITDSVYGYASCIYESVVVDNNIRLCIRRADKLPENVGELVGSEDKCESYFYNSFVEFTEQDELLLNVEELLYKLTDKTIFWRYAEMGRDNDTEEEVKDLYNKILNRKK